MSNEYVTVSNMSLCRRRICRICHCVLPDGRISPFVSPDGHVFVSSDGHVFVSSVGHVFLFVSLSDGHVSLYCQMDMRLCRQMSLCSCRQMSLCSVFVSSDVPVCVIRCPCVCVVRCPCVCVIRCPCVCVIRCPCVCVWRQMDVQRRRRALLSAAGGQLRQARQQAEHDLQAYCDSLVEAINRRKEALTVLLGQIYRDRVDNIGGTG